MTRAPVRATSLSPSMQISAGSPADGHIHRGDVILEIDQKPISSMFHTDALNLIQHAGGQITFILQRFSRSDDPVHWSNAYDLEAQTWLPIRRTHSSLNVHYQPCPGPTAMLMHRGQHPPILSVLWYDPCPRDVLSHRYSPLLFSHTFVIDLWKEYPSQSQC